MDERKATMAKLALDAEIAHLRDICGDDPELLADMIEGETDLDRLVGKLIGLIGEDKAAQKAIGEYQKTLADRKKRMGDREGRLRTLLASIVIQLPDRKYKHALGTLNASNTDPDLIIEDESAIPSAYWLPQDPKLDRARLRKHMNDRAKALAGLSECRTEEERQARLAEINADLPDIAGISLDNGDISITIRS